ncbi:MAG TPA: 4a-hydroxytetrahydrobiopterin dehydratase [Casimicrobiaceae bacterium]|nr:4a-hydroxytetrahydrobiopterin dehydratase [Casimicrobiaceae bacterium]
MTLQPALAELAALHCTPGAARLAADELASALAALPGWSRRGDAIARDLSFADYHQTIGFVNAIAFVANRENHHPDLQVSYNRCVVAWSTHDAGGVTRNDLICAAKVEHLLAG